MLNYKSQINQFPQNIYLENVYFVTMTRYYPNYKLNIFVENEEVKNTL